MNRPFSLLLADSMVNSIHRSVILFISNSRFHSLIKYSCRIQGPDDPKPAYTFELTTNFFAIDPSGVLVVNEENLDRDPPSPGRFRFQVVAREKTGVAASSPLSFVVTLNDVNDNAPLLPMMAPITVQAGETKKQVAKVAGHLF